MWMMDLFKNKQNAEQNKQVDFEIEEKQKIDIVFRGHWDLFGNREMIIRNSAKMLVRDGHAKDMIDGIVLSAKLSYDLDHVSTVQDDQTTTVVLKGYDFYDYRL